MNFRDRTDAGRLLADALVPAPAPPFVVGAIPRGGVTVALPLVERFRAPLALVYAGKLTAAVAPEFAFGAPDEDGGAPVAGEPGGSSSAPPIASWASSSIRRSRPSASTTSTSRPCRTTRCERCSPARERRPPRRLAAICVVDAVEAGC